MIAGHPRHASCDAGYRTACQVCGVPADANYFDVAGIKPAPRPGEQVELARYELHPQYCGALLFFAQLAEPDRVGSLESFRTPGYQWMILCNDQPRDPYLPTDLILNPWGQNAFPVHLRLEEGCAVRFVVRGVSPQPNALRNVGGRLVGRYWYNVAYGGTPSRL
jgi:hypothetical protein